MRGSLWSGRELTNSRQRVPAPSCLRPSWCYLPPANCLSFQQYSRLERLSTFVIIDIPAFTRSFPQWPFVFNNIRASFVHFSKGARSSRPLSQATSCPALASQVSSRLQVASNRLRAGRPQKGPNQVPIPCSLVLWSRPSAPSPWQPTPDACSSRPSPRHLTPGTCSSTYHPSLSHSACQETASPPRVRPDWTRWSCLRGIPGTFEFEGPRFNEWPGQSRPVHPWWARPTCHPHFPCQRTRLAL